MSVLAGLVKRAEAAKLLGISTTTLKRYEHVYRLAPFALGPKLIYYRRSDLERFATTSRAETLRSRTGKPGRPRKAQPIPEAS